MDEQHVNWIIIFQNKDTTVNIDDSSYEVLYNGSCHLLAVGNYEEALKRLKEAENLCRTYLIQEDGATEEEVAEEVAIIRLVRFLLILGEVTHLCIIFWFVGIT